MCVSMNKLVSVIMPVYNVEKYIAKCVQSVLNQTYKNFELLVIDDGSPDGSIKVVEAYNDPRIKIFRKTNGGLSDARNFGLERASGDYIYFIDSDDWVEPTLLKESVSVMETEVLDLVIFGYINDKEDIEGKLLHSKACLPTDTTFLRECGHLKIDKAHFRLLGYAWNKVYRKSFLDRYCLRFEKGTSLVEDILFNSTLLAKINKIRFIGKSLYHYSSRPVETLNRAYYEDSFELNVKRTRVLEIFLNSWNVDEKHKNQILSLSLVSGIRYCIHSLFSFKNQLSDSTRNVRIKEMVTHPMTVRLIDYYEVDSIKDWLYKKLISKSSTVITAMAKNIK